MCGEVLLPEPHFALVLELFRITGETECLAEAHFVWQSIFAMLAFGVLVSVTQQRLAVASIQERSQLFHVTKVCTQKITQCIAKSLTRRS